MQGPCEVLGTPSRSTASPSSGIETRQDNKCHERRGAEAAEGWVAWGACPERRGREKALGQHVQEEWVPRGMGRGSVLG